MRIAIVSDIHANEVALKAILEDANAFAVDRWFSLGDVVGYGPDPSACLRWARENCDINLLGNHDAAVAGLLDSEHLFRDVAHTVVLRHRELLSDEQRAWLANLPTSEHLEDANLLLVHGAPGPDPFLEYVVWDVTPLEVFERTPYRLIGVGHSHIPFLYEFQPHTGVIPIVAFGAPVPSEKIAIKDSSRYLFNPGSVGQPRDRDPRAAYLLWDTDLKTLTFRRVPYDIMETQRRMAKCDYPAWLAERLQYGQ
ncbi:MAG: metallophosphoesterase family protein [bacterium JZ-2024 1]